jgi:hypothetical protein
MVRQVIGQDIILNQTAGVCVSKGWSWAVDGVKCVQIAQGRRELFPTQPGGGPALCASEVIYAGSRVEIGGGKIWGDGSVGAWAAQYVSQYGTLIRGVYGQWDLTHEDDRIATSWGRRGQGVPDALEPLVKEHPIKTASLVQSYEEARDAIVNGYPVTVCSTVGFRMQRDSDGFAAAGPTWPHCMVFVAVDDAFRRPGLLCQNSWGPNWISGPKRHDQPEGSFWVDAETCNRMLSGRSMGGADSFAVSGYVGYPAQKLSHTML